MNVAIDLDGVILDNYEAWLPYYNSMSEEHGHPIVTYNDINAWGFFEELCLICLDHCLHAPDIALACKPFPHVVGDVKSLSNIADHLYLVTHRPYQISAATIQNLKDNGLYSFFDNIFIGHNSKRETCARLNCSYLIDDKPQTVREIEGSGCIPLLYTQPWNKNEVGFFRTNSIKETVNWIEFEKNSPMRKYILRKESDNRYTRIS